jgi:hypothetical protein
MKKHLGKRQQSRNSRLKNGVVFVQIV